jgi:hypothetical protein
VYAVQAREQELVADLKDEHLADVSQWEEAAEIADDNLADKAAQVCCLNLLVTATGHTKRVLAVSLMLQHMMRSQHVIPQEKPSSADKSTGK